MPVLTEASPPKAEPEGEAESQPMDTNESIPQEPTPAPTAAQPRLMITQIMTENFKSYAGKVVLGPFHKVCGFSFFNINLIHITHVHMIITENKFLRRHQCLGGLFHMVCWSIRFSNV